MNKDIKGLILPWALIVLSFLFASIWIDRKIFYLFDIFWRVAIIGGVCVLGRVRFCFSLKQWVVLALIFVFNFGIARVFSSLQSISSLVSNVVLAPLSEEVFFRGWLLSKLKGSQRDKIVKSSLFFSLYHLKNAFILAPLAWVYQLLYTGLVVGPIFAWVKLRYNSLPPSIALHSINNMIGLTMTERFLPLIIKKRPEV